MTKLEEANNYQELNKIPEEEKPLFHVTAPVGWLNDPNGFSSYDDKFHLFYQYHPYSVKWGPMYWGHKTTKDFVTWDDLPIALAPEDEYDSYGCYSGSAITTEDGKHALVYTGVVEEVDENGVRNEIQTQCLALGDGVTYEKIPENPIITQEHLPEGFSKYHFRDPKIWKEVDTYYLVVGNLDEKDDGQVLLFESKDMKDWKYVSVLADNHNGKYGRMWECPDFFNLDSHSVLLVSPQDMLAEGIDFYNGNHGIVLIGDYDENNHHLRENQIEMLDYGTEFYAPQTLLTEDGRRIMIAWMASWDMSHVNPIDQKWNGMMTLPRELHIRDGKLHQYPVKEIENYWTDSFSIDNFNLSGEISFPEIRGRVIDFTVNIEGGDYSKFTVYLGKNDRFQTSVTYNREKGIIKFDRTYSGMKRDVVCERKLKVENASEEISIRFILDRNSVEIFINDGRQTLTSLMYTPQEADQIVFESEGTAELNITSHKLNFEK